jgi:hypothetical protein
VTVCVPGASGVTVCVCVPGAADHRTNLKRAAAAKANRVKRCRARDKRIVKTNDDVYK